MLDVKTVLVPVDFHEASVAALDAATTIASKFGAKIVALHVIPPPAITAVAGMPVPPEVEERTPSSAANDLIDLAGQYSGGIECTVHRGDAESVILKEADEFGCDLIVMGTAGRGGIGRVLLGSVAEHVSRKAQCPVLLIKAPPTEETGRQRKSSTRAVRK